MVVAGEPEGAGSGDGKEAEERQQLMSICLETKMPSDVVAAVLATKRSDGDAAEEKFRKVEATDDTCNDVENEEEGGEEETAKELEGEECDVDDESLTISMLVDEDRENDRSPTSNNDDTKAVADDEEARPAPTIASSKVAESTRIDEWIAAVKRQNRQRTSSVVYYDEAMPSLDDLLAAREGWSQEFVEEALTTTSSSGSRGGGSSSTTTTIDPDLDLSFGEYAEVICALLGVPIYKGLDGTASSSRSLIQSLHLVMAAFLEADEAVEVADAEQDIF